MLTKPPAKPRKLKRPTDPNRAAHAMIAEHMARLEVNEEPAKASPPLDCEAAYKAHMAKLGAKSAQVGGKRRMEMLTQDERSAIASKAAHAIWSRC
jgi:hypothetical protein